MSATALCSCNATEPHEVARRRTGDGITVVLWSDGGVSGAMGRPVWGDAARTIQRNKVYMRAGWLLVDEVCLYDASEVRRLVKVSRRACEQRRETPLVHLRRVMAGRPYRVRPPAERRFDNEITCITEYDEASGKMLRYRTVHRTTCRCIACLRGRLQAGLGLP
jgi:hypothetical protein